MRVWMPAWRSASVSDLYESVRSTYLPTIAMSTSSFGMLQRVDQLRPTRQVGRRRVEAELVADDVVQALVVQQQRHLVDVVDVAAPR